MWSWQGRQCVLGYQPWIPALDTSFIQNGCQSEFKFFKFVITNIIGIWCICVLKTVLKLILWILTHHLKATRLHSKYNFSFVVLKWLAPSNGGSVLTRCRKIPVSIKIAAKVNLSFSLYKHKYYWNMLYLCPQNSFKINIVDIYTSFEGNKAAQ